MKIYLMNLLLLIPILCNAQIETEEIYIDSFKLKGLSRLDIEVKKERPKFGPANYFAINPGFILSRPFALLSEVEKKIGVNLNIESGIYFRRYRIANGKIGIGVANSLFFSYFDYGFIKENSIRYTPNIICGFILNKHLTLDTKVGWGITFKSFKEDGTSFSSEIRYYSENDNIYSSNIDNSNYTNFPFNYSLQMRIKPNSKKRFAFLIAYTLSTSNFEVSWQNNKLNGEDKSYGGSDLFHIVSNIYSIGFTF